MYGLDRVRSPLRLRYLISRLLRNFLLNCCSEAPLYLYTHDRLWPELADLAASIGSVANIVAPSSGLNCFDETYSNPWAALQDQFSEFSIPMACHSATIELRGLYDVRSSTYLSSFLISSPRFLMR